MQEVFLTDILEHLRSQDLVVVIATIYGPDSWGFEFRQGQEVFLCSKTIQTGSGAHVASYYWVLGSFPRGKAAM
jgi:hypothetical protein